MILYPAIDLKDGACVRLKRGEMAEVTIFNNNPAVQAVEFERQGFSYLHVVDLNGAFEGKPVNGAAIEAILASISIPIQLGGGVRDMPTIDMWLGKGVARVILGTAAVHNPWIVRDACAAYPCRIVVGIDARDGRVAVQGWAEASDMTALDLARRFEDAGVAAIIYTDIARDGMLEGLNLDATATLARAVSIPIIASGGLSGMDDIRRLASPEFSVIAGAIAGRALYDGRIDPVEALRLMAGPKRASPNRSGVL